MTQLKQGKSAPLNVTKEARHRIFVGLGWDPNDNPGIGEQIGALIGSRKKHHDLDLTCFYFGKDGDYMGLVSGDSAYHSDESGRIYHSGDSVEGVGEGDDEQISAELKDMPLEIHHLVFSASIKSGHHFGDIAQPEIRLCDGYTGRVFLETSLKTEDGKAHNAFAFVQISRDGDGWSMRNISEFADQNTPEYWCDALKRFL